MIQQTEKLRIPYLDVLRALAVIMVIMVHAGDVFLYNSTTQIFTTETTFLLVLLRPAVPMFIIMSSILLLPIKTDTKSFFKRRFTRVFIPFFIWSIFYVFLPTPSKLIFGGPENVFTDAGLNVFLYNLMMIPINFTGSNVHFWFIYVILGLYLFMPIISPWIKTANKNTLLFFLALWTLTMFLPIIRLYFPEVHGECDWNRYGMFYYFGGYLGYVILGYFLHHYNTLKRNKSVTIGAILFTVGTFITYWGMKADQQMFLNQLANTNIENWLLLEFSIDILSPNVVMMTTGMFMIFQKIKISSAIEHIFKEISVLSYGIFLAHYIVVLWVSYWMKDSLPLNPGIVQLFITLTTFIVSYFIVKIISYIPKSKYIIG